MNAATLTPSPSRPHKIETDKRSQADKRIDFLLEKHFRNDPEQRPLLLKLAEHDPTPKKKYLAWLVKHWTGAWKPSDKELKKVSEHLETHHKGAKYFSPLSWTGLRLEDAGYHADIFRYTPQTLGTMSGKIAEMIRIDEEDKQIRKGNLVVTGGAEVAYQDDDWTLLRVHTDGALRRLGQGTSWCVKGGLNRFRIEYGFPFDFLLNREGERFLAYTHEVRNRWNDEPPSNLLLEIKRVRASAENRHAQLSSLVEESISTTQRLDVAIEQRLLRHADLAIRYAEKVIGGVWTEFESHVELATLSATHATDYAIKCRRDRWQRFENKIKRSRSAVTRYREAFPGSIPKTSSEIFQEKLADWREQKANAKRPRRRWSIQWQAESRKRNVDFEDRLLRVYSEASIERYARFVVSLATSELEPEYRKKFRSYFLEAKDEKTRVVNEELGPTICSKIHQRLPEIEPLIADDAENGFAYAMATGQRFPLGEAVIMRDAELWERYSHKYLRPEPPPCKPQNEFPRFLPPRTFKVAWR